MPGVLAVSLASSGAGASTGVLGWDNLNIYSYKKKCLFNLFVLLSLHMWSYRLCLLLQVDGNPPSLMTDCLIIKHFLRKIIIVHHKVKLHIL